MSFKGYRSDTNTHASNRLLYMDHQSDR